MVPAQIMARAVAMLANPLAQLLDLGYKLLTRHLLEIVIHLLHLSIWSAVACYRLRLAKLASPRTIPISTPKEPAEVAHWESWPFRGSGSKLAHSKGVLVNVS